MTDIGRPHTLASAGEGSARSNATGYMDRASGSRYPSSRDHDIEGSLGQKTANERTRYSGDGNERPLQKLMPTLLEKKFASWEVVYVVFLRVIVFAFISIAVTVVAWFAYSQAKDSEMRTFLVEYEAVVETARQRLQEGVSSRLHAAEAASAVFSSVRGDLVIANFWDYAKGAVPTASLRFVAFVPLVLEANQTDFLALANASMQGLFPLAGQLSGSLQARFSGGTLPPYSDGSASPAAAQLDGLAAPLLQVAPLAEFSGGVLADLSADPAAAAALAAALDLGGAVCSDVLQLREDLPLSSKRPSSLVFHPVALPLPAAPGAPSSRPPAFVVAAVAAAAFSWDDLLRGVVPPYLGGLGMELRGPLNRTTVIEISGDRISVGFDDSFRDRTLERYRRTFAVPSGPAGAGPAAQQPPSFTVDVYPKASFLNWFLSTRPRDTAVGVVSIVFGIGLVVTVYDVLGRLRLRTMTALAARQLKRFLVKPSELHLPPMRKVALVTQGVAAGKTGARLARKSQTEAAALAAPGAAAAAAAAARGAVTGRRIDRSVSKKLAGSAREHGHGHRHPEEALLKAQYVLFRGTPCVLIPILLGEVPGEGSAAGPPVAAPSLPKRASVIQNVAATVGLRAGGGGGPAAPAARLSHHVLPPGHDGGVWGIAPGRFSHGAHGLAGGSQRSPALAPPAGGGVHSFTMRGESVKTFARAPKEWVQESNLLELCNLRHPQVATTFGAAVVSGVICAVQEYCSMGSLHHLLSSAVTHLELPELCKIALGVVTGCRYLHESTPPVTIHLSTHRVLIDSNFSPKVQVTFRVASHDVAHSMDEFTAPEVLDGGRATLQSDVYTVGVIFYRLFAEDRAFGSGDEPLAPSEVVDRIREWRKGKKHASQELIDGLRDVSLSCCNLRDPGGRPALSTVDGLVSTALAEAAAVKCESVRSDTEMLSQMMPKHVTDALKAGKKVEPELFEEITVFFSDIVGYTDISSTLPAEHVANMLDRLYQAFDKLALRHGLFKAETIGDAYMAMGGVPEFQPDHTLRVATFAAEAVATANRIQIDPGDPGKGTLNIRVGFHTGPAVACVVGTLRPKYWRVWNDSPIRSAAGTRLESIFVSKNLYGDTINTASRMESMSEPNRINMSLSAREALLDQAPNVRVTDRGAISVKGKGTMQCFFLETEPDAANGARLRTTEEGSGDEEGGSPIGSLRHDLPTRDDRLVSASQRGSGPASTPHGEQLLSRLGTLLGGRAPRDSAGPAGGASSSVMGSLRGHATTASDRLMLHAGSARPGQAKRGSEDPEPLARAV